MTEQVEQILTDGGEDEDYVERQKFIELQNEYYEATERHQHLAEILFKFEMEIESLAIDDNFLAEIREEVREGEGLYE